MDGGFAWWLVIVGIGIGVALAWLVMGRLPRRDDDVSLAERRAEAAWISRSIAEYGGVAPQPLVEEILELHRHYLRGTPLDADDEERWSDEEERLADEDGGLADEDGGLTEQDGGLTDEEATQDEPSGAWRRRPAEEPSRR